MVPGRYAEPRTYLFLSNSVTVKIFVPVLCCTGVYLSKQSCLVSNRKVRNDYGSKSSYQFMTKSCHFRMKYLYFALLASLAFAALAEEEGEAVTYSKVRIESCAG